MCSSSVSKSLTVILLLNSAVQLCSAQEPMMLKRLRLCLTKPFAIVCLKEEALDFLNRTIMNEKPMRFFDVIEIEKDVSYRPNLTENDLPRDMTERSNKLNDLLYNKVEEFFESRSIRFNLASVIEGRKKKDKTGTMLMMGGLAMAGMMGQLFIGKVAFLAGAALLVAKMALMLSAISALKKSGSSGGGGEAHVVYTSSADSGYGGGGWHRSLNYPDNHSHNMVYPGHASDNGYSY